MATCLEKAIDRLAEVAIRLRKTAASSEIKTIFSSAFPFLDATGDVIMAWMLLWRASAASQRL